MKKTIIRCDRCGKKIDGRYTELDIYEDVMDDGGTYSSINYQLCKDCKNELDIFIEEIHNIQRGF